MLAILDELKQYSDGSGLVIESPMRPGHSVSENTLLFALYRLGYRGRMESRSIVMLGDCCYFGINPLKNFLYEKANLGSYDKAQQAESRRVAYVGITRAMESCYWYAVKKDNGAIERIPKGRNFVVTTVEK